MAFAQAKTLCLSSGSAEGTAKLLYSGDMDLLFAETHKDLGKYGQEIIQRHNVRVSNQAARAAAHGEKRGAAAGSGGKAARQRGLSEAPPGRQNGASGTSSATQRNPAPMPAAHIALAAKVRAAPLHRYVLDLDGC